MKLTEIVFENHKFFKDMTIDFTNKNNALNTIVLIGENGVGKSTLLREIRNILTFKHSSIKERNVTAIIRDDVKNNEAIELANGSCKLVIKGTPEDINFISECWDEESNNKLNSRSGKVIYMPTEVNFDNINKVDNTFKFIPHFFNVVDQNLTQNIPSFIATKINKEIFKNRNKTIGEVIDKVCSDVNSIFECMEMDVKLIGLSEDENTTPVFKNSFGNEFNIDGLSSGEKQLFLRALSLKFLNADDSIILIDEPEISLHPKWQKRIIKVYESIGKNNQIILATHSPHIISDIKKEQLRILKKDNESKSISVVNGNDIDEIYGQNVESILQQIMGIDNVRNDDIAGKFQKIYVLLEKNEYDTPEFKNIFDYLTKYLGTLDKDIMRIKLEQSKRRKMNNVKDN